MQFFKNISYLNLGEGEMGEAWASCCGTVDRGRDSQVESMASLRKMLIEIIVDLSVVTVFPSLSAVGSWEVLLFSMDFSVPEFFGVRATGCKFLFEKASLCFPNCVCLFVPNFTEKLHIVGAIRC